MKTKIVFLLDESGSMNSIKDQTVSGFNEYVDTVKKETEVTMTLTKFNSAGVKVEYVNKPIKDVPHLTDSTFKPDALTPLYDALGKTISQLDEDLEKEKEEYRVLFIVMTDGEENQSREYDKDKIVKLITKKEDDWTFVYLGADQDAWLEASKFGISSAGSTMSYSSKETGETFAKLGRATGRFMSTSKKSTKDFVTKYMK